MQSLGITNGVFLFVSDDKQSLENQAVSFARNLLSYRSEDVALNERIFKTEDEFISAEMINDFISFEAKKSVGVASKILILHDVDLLRDNVSDKMLKCIEDYNNDSLIILTTTSIEKVSRTIKSRCMVFKEWNNDNSCSVDLDQALSFITQMDDLTAYADVQGLLDGMKEQAAMPTIQAMFFKEDPEILAIASNALDLHLTGSNDQQVNTYIVNSIWCLKHNLRSWKKDESVKEAC